VTFKGQPVPTGEIYLRPVSGPGGFALIKNGEYETIKGRGFESGLSKITFHGFGKSIIKDGEEYGGRDLFPPHTVELDLPQEDFILDRGPQMSITFLVEFQSRHFNARLSSEKYAVQQTPVTGTRSRMCFSRCFLTAAE